MDNKKCPKCGSPVLWQGKDKTKDCARYACGTETGRGIVDETRDCLRNQLAQANARADADADSAAGERKTTNGQ